MKTTGQHRANIVGATARCSWTFDLCSTADVSLWSALICFDVDSKDLRLVKLTSAAHASLFSFADVLKGTNAAWAIRRLTSNCTTVEVKGQQPSRHRHQFWCPGWQSQVLIRVLNVLTAQYRRSRLTRRPALAFDDWWTDLQTSDRWTWCSINTCVAGLQEEGRVSVSKENLNLCWKLWDFFFFFFF